MVKYDIEQCRESLIAAYPVRCILFVNLFLVLSPFGIVLCYTTPVFLGIATIVSISVSTVLPRLSRSFPLPIERRNNLSGLSFSLLFVIIVLIASLVVFCLLEVFSVSTTSGRPMERLSRLGSSLVFHSFIAFPLSIVFSVNRLLFR